MPKTILTLQQVWTTIEDAARHGENILISGTVGSGKSTLQQALLAVVPNRIVLESVHEIRDGQALELTDTANRRMSTVVSTIHANEPELVPRRMYQMSLLADPALNQDRYLAQFHQAFDWIVHVDRFVANGERTYCIRKLLSVRETGLEPMYVTDDVAQTIDLEQLD